MYIYYIRAKKFGNGKVYFLYPVAFYQCFLERDFVHDKLLVNLRMIAYELNSYYV